MILYSEGKDEAEEEKQIPKLPQLEKGDRLELVAFSPSSTSPSPHPALLKPH